MGQVFTLIACCFLCSSTYLPITIRYKFYKNTFSLFWYCALRKKFSQRIHFTIQTCLVITCFMCCELSQAVRDVSITAKCGKKTRNAHIFHLHFANCVKNDDRSMMDWKMIVAKYVYGWNNCKIVGNLMMIEFLCDFLQRLKHCSDETVFVLCLLSTGLNFFEFRFL